MALDPVSSGEKDGVPSDPSGDDEEGTGTGFEAALGVYDHEFCE